MEYGLRITTPDSVLKTPRELLSSVGCDNGQWDLVPESHLTALYFGSEFCQELIPGSKEAQAFCTLCAQHELEAVLLTPVVTHKGLERLQRLFDRLSSLELFPAIVFNDWGVLELLRETYPRFPLRMGRLMNRGLRDPRLDMQAMLPDGENTHRGSGIRQLAISLGVKAVESDADLEPGFLGNGSNGLTRTLHVPFTFVSSGRNCLEKAAAAPADKGLFTHGLKTGCSAPCRGICRPEVRQDTQKNIWRAGNTVFFETPPEWISRHIKLADRVVFHEQPMP